MDESSKGTEKTPPPAKPAPRKKYVKAVGPRLRIVLRIVFALFALLVANSVYLASITAMEWSTGLTYQDFFYLSMFLLHLALGLLLIVPFVVFGVVHLLATRNRKNRRAVRIGYALFFVSILLLLSGLLLMRVEGFEIKWPIARSVVYWLHVACPLTVAWLYWLHRLAGPRIKWRAAAAYGLAVVGVVMVMVVLQQQDPRRWNVEGPDDGVQYFEPSLVRTGDGNFIPARVLMNDQYCIKCHEDVYKGWFHSSHHFSSFNNPAYLASVRETREVSLKRDGTVKASRWCAGCHDPVPFLSGAFDDPKFDDVNDPTSQAGITCTVCHAITHINDAPRGNADYTIEQPLHYPFAFSKNSVLQYVNNQLVKAKPSFHKKTFLKPFHKTAEFCATCHKVHLPKALTKYKEFLRGQNHYDTFLLSGVSGTNPRAFYHPPHAEENCNGCHMPLSPSRDFGARMFPGAKTLSIHDHTFVGANTGLAWLKGQHEAEAAHRRFLEGCVRVDLFGVKEDGEITGKLHAPLRPQIPTLRRGHTYLLETVIRTLRLGHHFTQGTADSNQVWLEVKATSGERVVGHSGAVNEQRRVDERAYFVNVFMLDKDGNRIDRRNAQDIFVPLYNHQIPPGAARVVHYRLDVPGNAGDELTVEVKLNYRKFDSAYFDYFTQNARPGDHPIRGVEPGKPALNPLPITVLARDTVTFKIVDREADGGTLEETKSAAPEIPIWQRWNDYGIGLLLEGTAELRQAGDAFREVARQGRSHGQLNLARVLHKEGAINAAVDAVKAATEMKDPAPPWTVNWLSALLNREQGRLVEAERNLRALLQEVTPEMERRGLDFSRDYVVNNLLGRTLFDRAEQVRDPAQKDYRKQLLRDAVAVFERTLEVDSENVTAHHNLQLLYSQLGEQAKADHHQRLHEIYKPDFNARDQAVVNARRRYPAANNAAEPLYIYPLELPQPAAAANKPPTSSGSNRP